MAASCVSQEAAAPRRVRSVTTTPPAQGTLGADPSPSADRRLLYSVSDGSEIRPVFKADRPDRPDPYCFEFRPLPPARANVFDVRTLPGYLRGTVRGNRALIAAYAEQGLFGAGPDGSALAPSIDVAKAGALLGKADEEMLGLQNVLTAYVALREGRVREAQGRLENWLLETADLLEGEILVQGARAAAVSQTACRYMVVRIA